MVACGRLIEGRARLMEVKQMNPERVGLERIFEFARHHFAFDVVYLFELRVGRIEARAVTCDAESFRVGRDGALAIEDTYTHRMVTGRIPNLIPDVRCHPELAELQITRTAAIGSFVGVPVRCPGGAVWGTLTGLNHAPRADLDERSVASLALLADLLCFDAEDYARRMSGAASAPLSALAGLTSHSSR